MLLQVEGRWDSLAVVLHLFEVGLPFQEDIYGAQVVAGRLVGLC